MRKERRKPPSGFSAQIDISKALEAPVRLNREGQSRPMDPYEAMLRQHVRKSLVQKLVPSMKLVLDEAERHKLIKEPAQGPKGGTFVVPKDVPEDIQREIFSSETTSMLWIMGLLLKVIDLDRLKRCFHG